MPNVALCLGINDDKDNLVRKLDAQVTIEGSNRTVVIPLSIHSGEINQMRAKLLSLVNDCFDKYEKGLNNICDIYEDHARESELKGYCEQCQYPYHDGICDCGHFGDEMKKIADKWYKENV